MKNINPFNRWFRARAQRLLREEVNRVEESRKLEERKQQVDSCEHNWEIYSSFQRERTYPSYEVSYETLWICKKCQSHKIVNTSL